ncbi:MAG: IS4 family transposase [Pseudomonadota bacterium]
MGHELERVEAVLAAFPFTGEYADIDLGHRARENRARKILEVLRQHPDKGFPKAFGDRECDRFYEFLSNDDVTAEQLLEPHVRRSTLRSMAAEEVLIVHDSSEFEWKRTDPIDGMTNSGQGASGFLGHFSIAVSPDCRICYGVLNLETIVREKRTNPKVPWRIRYDDPEKESLRWWRGIQESEGRLPETVSMIHIMDRDGDIFEQIALMVERGQRLVVRMRKDRLVCSGTDEHLTILGALREVPALACREVNLSARKKPLPAAARRFPERERRNATLALAACSVAIRRPGGLDKTLPKSVPLNVVRVWEPEPPPGLEPVEWILLTTEPIDTVEAVLKVVDYSRSRWLIEEFFKALKTGCLVERRQLESAEAIAKTLALFVPIACELLALRALARLAPDAPAEDFVSEEKIQVLRAISKRKLPEKLSIQAFYMAVAALAGHLKRNGEPGWKLLGEGYRELLKAQAVWKKAREFFEARTPKRRRSPRGDGPKA